MKTTIFYEYRNLYEIMKLYFSFLIIDIHLEQTLFRL